MMIVAALTAGTRIALSSANSSTSISHRHVGKSSSARSIYGSTPFAITSSTYSFTNSSSVALEDMSSGTTQLIGANQEDTASSLNNIGFDFWFDGQRQTQFSINANGLLKLGSPAVTTLSTNDLASIVNTPQIAPYWDDLFIGSNGKAQFKTIGSAPNRKLIVEWQNIQIPRTGFGNTGAGTFQCWLFETTGVIEFVYGSGIATNSANGGYSAGFGSSGSAFASVTTSVPTANYGTANNTQTNAIASGTKYTFTPLIPSDPTGLNFASVTQTSMTLNWIDNSSNELGFVIYRSDDGGASYTFATQTGAGATSSTQTSLIPGTTYFWKVFAVTEGALSANAATGSNATSPAGNIVSTSTGGNWSSTATWVGGIVPTATDNVTIADGATVTIDVTNATCLNLVVGQGASGNLEYISTPASALTVNADLTVTSGATFTAGSGTLTTHVLNIGGTNTSLAAGNLTVNGTLDLSTTAAVTANFQGSSNSTLSGAGATCNFWTIVTNKGLTSAPVMDVTRVITVNAPTVVSANRLTVTRGTFKLSSASTLTPYSVNATIAATNGRLWINNSLASVTSNGVGTAANAGAPTIDGILQIDAGTFGYGSGNNTMIVTGSVIMGGADATLNMFGVVNFSSTSRFTMTGGNFNVDCQAANSAGFGSQDTFLINNGSIVSFTGGTLTLVDPHLSNTSPTNADLRISGSANTLNFMGSTIRFGDGVSTTSGNATTGGFQISSPIGITLGTVIVNNPSGINRDVRINSSTSTTCNLRTLNVIAGTFNLNGNTLTVAADIANNGTINGDATGATLSFVGTAQQTVSGSGSYANNRIRTVTVNNSSGASPAINLNQGVAITTALNLTAGSVGGSGTLTLGDPGASATLTTTRSSGSLANSPTLNLTGVTYNVAYTAPSPAAAISTGFELPSSISGTLTINNSSGLVLNAATTVNGGLTLTSGLITTTATNLLTLGSSVSGPAGSTASFVNGPLAIDIPTTAAISRNYAVGKGTSFRPVAISSLSLTVESIVTVEVFNSASGGTPVSPLQTLDPARYWVVTNSAGLNASARIRLTYDTDDFVFDTTPARVAESNASNGSYSSLGGSVTGSIFSGTIVSTVDLAPGSDYFTIGNESAVPISWDGGAGTSNWGDALNWSNDTVPDNSTDVALNLGSPTTINVNGTFSTKNLTIGSNTTLNFGSGILNVNGNYIQSNGTVNINTGSLNVTGASTITSGTTNINSGTYVSTGAFTVNGGTLANGTGTLNCKADFTLSSGSFTVTAGTSGGTTIFSGSASQNISGFSGGTSLNNLTLQGGGAGLPKRFTAGRPITAANDLVVATTAQIALNAATGTTINVGGSLAYGGVTGGANISSLTLNLTGSNKTINGTSLAASINPGGSFAQDVNTETVNLYSDPKKYLGMSKDKVKLDNTYAKKRDAVEALIGKKDPNRKLIINLDDTTIVSNASTSAPLAPTPSGFEMNVTIASGANYTMLDNINMASGRTLNVTGRLNADTFTIGGAGNITVTGSTTVVGNGTIGTATPSASGLGATLVNTGTNTFTDAIIEYNASGAQTINATNHPSAAMIYTAGSGTKTLNGNKTISGDSGDPLTKGALFVGSGTTFADGGFTLSFTNLLGFDNVIVNGSFLSTGSGGLSFESGPTFSAIQAVDGTQFGNLTLNFALSDEAITLDSSGTATFTFRNMTFGGTAGAGVAGGTLQLNDAGTTNVIVTGSVSISPSTTSNNGGGFGGTASTTATVTVRGNITTTSTATTQPIFNNTGTNTLVIGQPSIQQTLTLGANATIFTGSKLQIDNPAGLLLGGTLRTFTLGSGGTLTVSTGAQFVTGNNTFTNSGTTIFNGTFVVSQGGAGSGGGGTYSYHATTGTLTFNTTSVSTIDGTRTYWPATNGPQNVTVIGTAGLTMSVARTVGILFQTAAGVTGAANLTFNGTCRINAGGSFTGTPTFGSGSLLIYNSGTTFSRGPEWSATSGAGFPYDVQLSNNTLLDVGAGGISTACAIAHNMTVDSGAALSMDVNAGGHRMQAPVTVGGALLINGTVTLSSANGSGDLNVGGNWTNNGTFTNNSKIVTFNGASAQIIGGSNSSTFSSLTITNTTSVTMTTNCSVTSALTLNGDLTVDAANGKVLTATGSTSTGTKDVIGTVQRSDITTARAFGNPNVQITNGSAMTLQVTLVKASPTGFGAAVNRVYTLNSVSGSVSGATVRLHYLNSELNGNTGTNLHLWRADGSPGATWTDQGAPSSTQTGSEPNNWIQNTAVAGFSSWTMSSTPAAPTMVKLRSFKAESNGEGVDLSWVSGFEVDNLGYQVYAELNGARRRVTPAVVAGSALKVGPRSKLAAGYAYSWFDREGTPDTAYYLEAIDLNGTSALTGPIYPMRGDGRSTQQQQRAALLSEVSQASDNTTTSDRFEQRWPASMGANQNMKSIERLLAAGGAMTRTGIANGAAVKISVSRTGWYRVTQPELIAGGLDANSDARRLQLYVDAQEIPMVVNGGNGGRLESGDSIEFYGQALDTLSTDTHVYWLVNGSTSGKRINRPKPATKPNGQDWTNLLGGSFMMTVERRDKLIYFARALNGEGDNIFGPVVTNDPTTQSLTLTNVDNNATSAQLSVSLQGVLDGDHQVEVQLNGTPVGVLSFCGRTHPTQSFTVARSLLRPGTNDVTLTAQGGELDINLVDAVSLTYAHTYRADSNALRFSVAAGQTVVVSGFNSPAIRAIDITSAAAANEVSAPIGVLDGGYAMKLQAGSNGGTRTYLTFIDELAAHPSGIAANQPSSLITMAAVDMLVITHKDLRSAVEPLAAQRRSEGLTVAVVDVEDVYDEFSYGAHSPYAVRDFLSWTNSHWTRAPRYLLLVGDSSWDPRNYMGQGFADLVPTKLVDTAFMETASDDWLSDFDGDGIADVATGRLPARTSAEATLMVNKILAYAHEQQQGTPLRGALLVSDSGFESESSATAGLLPAAMSIININRTDGSDDITRTQIVNSLNQGPLVANYFGHGSVSVWTGAGLLDSDLALNLTNSNRPTLFVMMTCLNGYTHDVYVDSLAESLLKAPQGGAMAVWASSGFTDSDPQALMSNQFYRQLFSGASVRLGDAFKPAKLSISDPDVQRTWLLFGDPAMRLR